uniref:Uncharacterized protein n=1 Tax=uncultured prokaryote TaxID=198431 RepID=A0A0H5Q7F6_9ZZZZ|nr:hypothetical protein [uncultured prokaryote]
MHQSPVFHVSIRRDTRDPALVRITIRKGWFTVGKGGESRVVVEHFMDSTGMGEADVVRGALHDAAEAIVDRLG